MTILIVEDEEGPMTLWKQFLGPLTQDLREARTMREAFEQMRLLPKPDLVLFDLRLPDSRQAEESLRRIQELKMINPNAVVMVVTGAVDDNLPALAKELGADGFYRKPDMAGQEKLLRAATQACQSQSTEGRLSMVEELSKLMSSLSAVV